MLDRVKTFFSKLSSNGTGEPSPDDGHDVRVATCALLLEMAQTDGEYSGPERENIIRILKEDYSLSGEDAADLLEEAGRDLKESIDLWRFTRLINEHYTDEEKAGIVEMLWKIVYTDGHLDKHEDYLVHKVSNLLNLTHRELIDAKLKVLHGSPDSR
jgi:uncharacterized tellurite resistance protein B-like protein